MILVTRATGELGRHVIRQLVQKVPANQILAAVRDPGKAADLAKLGVRVWVADGVRLDDRSLVPGHNPPLGAIRFKEWLREPVRGRPGRPRIRREERLSCAR
jgi:nucleoside-diphosphate-sugar epimerase